MVALNVPSGINGLKDNFLGRLLRMAVITQEDHLQPILLGWIMQLVLTIANLLIKWAKF